MLNATLLCNNNHKTIRIMGTYSRRNEKISNIFFTTKKKTHTNFCSLATIFFNKIKIDSIKNSTCKPKTIKKKDIFEMQSWFLKKKVQSQQKQA